jgi:AraC family transcriptional regulator
MPARLAVGEFFGKRIGVRDVAGFRLTECRFAPRARIPEHEHARAHFCVVLDGQYDERYGRSVRCCRPRNVILHPEGEIHSGRISSGGARDLCVEVSPERFAGIVQQLRIFQEPADFTGGPIGRHGLQLYKEFCKRDMASSLAIEAAVLELLVAATRAPARKTPGAPPRWLRRVHDHLLDLFPAQTSLSSLAEIAGVHVAHLARVFREHYGCSVGEYVRRLRIEASCRDLTRHDKPLAVIAANAGFYDQAHFSNVFRAQIGMTPGRFRALSRAR